MKKKLSLLIVSFLLCGLGYAGVQNITQTNATPEFSGTTAVAFGTVANNTPFVFTQTYVVTNDGDVDLLVDELSSHTAVTLVGLPVTVPPGESRDITVELRATILGTGNLANANFVLETNDPERETVTVNVTANVELSTVGGFIETFNPAVPTGWILTNWTRVNNQGIGSPTQAYRAEMNNANPQRSLTTVRTYVQRAEKTLNFWYRGSSNMNGANNPVANGTRFEVQISRDLDATWQTIYSTEFADAPTTNEWQEKTINLEPHLRDYLNQIIRIRFNFFRNPDVGALNNDRFVWLDDISIFSESPVFGGSLSANVGNNILNNVPTSRSTASPAIVNNGTEPLVLTYLSSSPSITVIGLTDNALTVAPLSSQSFTVQVNGHGLPLGIYSGEIVFSTNDPENSEITIAVTGTVTAQAISDLLPVQTFVAAPPATWAGTGLGGNANFAQVAATGVDGENGVYRVRLQSATVNDGRALTPWVNLGPNPVLSFYYRATNWIAAGWPTGPAVAPEAFSFVVELTPDYGDTWVPIHTVAQGEHIPGVGLPNVGLLHNAALSFTRVDVDLSDYANINTRIRFRFNRFDGDINFDLDNISISTAVTGEPAFSGVNAFLVTPGVVQVGGTLFNNIPIVSQGLLNIANLGTEDLEITVRNSHPNITIGDFEKTWESLETRGIPISVSGIGLAAGLFEGAFVLETNDPERPEITVNVRAQVAAAVITEAPFMENFTTPATGTVPGWHYNLGGVAFIRQGTNGRPPSAPHIRANPTAANPTAALRTTFIEMGENPLLSFWYRATTNTTATPTATAAINFSFFVLGSRDFGQSWDTLRIVAQGEANPSGDWQEIRIPMFEFSGDTVLIQIGVTRYSGTVQFWIDDFGVEELEDFPVFEGSPTLAMGTLYNNVAGALNWAHYSVTNAGTEVLIIDEISSSNGVTLVNLPLTIGIGEVRYIHVQVDVEGLSLGTSPNLNFVLETNDPTSPQVPVNITGTVGTLFICNQMNETFTATGLPQGWTNHARFGQNAAMGVGGEGGVLRANIDFGNPFGSVTTCPTTVPTNGLLTFYYRATNFMTGTQVGVATAAENFSFVVAITTDLGRTWETIKSVAQGEHNPTNQFTRVDFDLHDYIGEVVRVRFDFQRHAGDVNIDLDNVSIWETPQAPFFVGESAINFGRKFNTIDRPTVREYTITNRGRTVLEINEILSGNEIRIEGLPLALNFGESQTIQVILDAMYLPEGNYDGTMTIQTNDPENPSVIIDLSAFIKPIATSIFEDFSANILPENWAVSRFNVVNARGVDNSGCLEANLFGTAANAHAHVTLPFVQFSEYSTLSFVYQAANNAGNAVGEADATSFFYEIMISNDLGETWTTVYTSAAGSHVPTIDWTRITFPIPAEFHNEIGLIRIAFTGNDRNIWIRMDDITVFEMVDAPIFFGASSIDFGSIVSNQPPTYRTRMYEITNMGGSNMVVQLSAETSLELSLSGANQITVAPGETKHIEVRLDLSNLFSGAFVGQLVFETNDPDREKVTVEVSAVVSRLVISSFIEEDFDLPTTPQGWTLHRFGRQATGGINNSPALRVNNQGPAYNAHATVTTSFVAMGDNPVFSFRYHITNWASAGPPTQAGLATYTYAIFITRDFGATWEPVFGSGPNTQEPSLTDFHTVNLDVTDFANEIIQARIEFMSIFPATLWVWLDDVIIGTPVENDLAIFAFTGTDLPVVGEASSYTVRVRNYGQATQTNYTVRLMGEGNVQIAEFSGVEIANREIRDFEFVWTPTTNGPTYIWAEVVFANDDFLDNNRSERIHVVVLPENTGLATVGTGTVSATMPYHFGARNSLHQSIYFPHEIMATGGQIKGLIYTAVMPTRLTNQPIQVWIGETNQTDLTGGFIDPSTLTLVFDGAVDFRMGADNPFVLLFDQPFDYQGGNLVVYSAKIMPEVDFPGGNHTFRATTFPNSNRSRQFSNNATLGGAVPNPLAPPSVAASTLSHNVPNTTFVFDMSSVGTVEGVVTDGTDPLANVRIDVAGEVLYAVTNSLGQFSIPFLAPGNYTLEIAEPFYSAKSIEITVVAGEVLTRNIALTPWETVTVSGQVIGNNAPNGLGGVEITLFTTFDNIPIEFSTTTNATGHYTIENVFVSFAYTVRARLQGYTAHSSVLEVGTENVVYNFTLNQVPHPVVNPTVEIINGNAVVTWDNPDARIVFRWDSDVHSGSQVGLANATRNSVIGSAHRRNAIVERVMWFLSDLSDATTYVDVFIFGLNATGVPVFSDILFSQQNVPNRLSEWVTFELPQPIEAPNGFFIGLSSSTGGFLGIGTDVPNAEFPFRTSTHFAVMNFQTGSPTPFENAGLSANLKIRAEGIDIETTQATAFGYGQQLPTGEILNAPIVPLPISYSVYRLVEGAEETAWVLLSDNVTELTFTDFAFSGLPEGTYQYAIRANYAGGIQSEARLTNTVIAVEQETSVAITIEGDLFVVYPNPTSDVVHIETDQTIRQVTVFDQMGRAVKVLHGNLRTVDLQSLPVGNYILQIITETAVIPIRIVKQ